MLVYWGQAKNWLAMEAVASWELFAPAVGANMEANLEVVAPFHLRPQRCGHLASPFEFAQLLPAPLAGALAPARFAQVCTEVWVQEPYSGMLMAEPARIQA